MIGTTGIDIVGDAGRDFGNLLGAMIGGRMLRHGQFTDDPDRDAAAIDAESKKRFSEACQRAMERGAKLGRQPCESEIVTFVLCELAREINREADVLEVAMKSHACTCAEGITG